MKNVLILGFGRIAITHTSQIVGLLGAKNVNLTVVDPSFIARSICKVLYPSSSRFKALSELRKRIGSMQFDYAVVCVPPTHRDDLLSELANVKGKVLVEKPVGRLFRAEWQSGYVLQHAPLNIEINSMLSAETIESINMDFNTNIDFSKNASGNWRRSSKVSIITEFFGHLLTLLFSTLPVSNREVQDWEVFKISDNEITVKLIINDLPVNVRMLGNNANYRKADYCIRYDCKKSSYEYNIYSLKKDGNIISSIADNGVNTNFYLRGFDFAQQAEAFLSGSGDVLDHCLILNIEKLIEDIGLACE
ncbi:hypothetical protein N9C64_00635 [Paracoccaceae bacterium]|nr:hypothetical protein [Paracoccaceae bacterium]